eukprot:s7268_g2.t1
MFPMSTVVGPSHVRARRLFVLWPSELCVKQGPQVNMRSTQEPAMRSESKDLLGYHGAGARAAGADDVDVLPATVRSRASRTGRFPTLLAGSAASTTAPTALRLQKEAINIPTNKGRTLGHASQTDPYLDFQIFGSNAPFLADLLRRRMAIKGVGAVCAVQPGCCHKGSVRVSSEAPAATTAPAVFPID